MQIIMWTMFKSNYVNENAIDCDKCSSGSVSDISHRRCLGDGAKLPENFVGFWLIISSYWRRVQCLITFYLILTVPAHILTYWQSDITSRKILLKWHCKVLTIFSLRALILSFVIPSLYKPWLPPWLGSWVQFRSGFGCYVTICTVSTLVKR